VEGDGFMKSRVRTQMGRFLISILCLNSIVSLLAPGPTLVRAQTLGKTEVKQQNKVIVVNADQPNVWTLEQAHYLLAQMHRRNLDLKAKSLEELDANEITGLRFDVLRTLLEVGVKFDDANRVTNRMLGRNQTFNAERRQTLLNERAQLRKESLALTHDIAQLEEDKSQAESQEEKDRLDARIAAKKTLLAKVDKEIELDDKELETLTAPSGDFARTEAEVQFDPERLPKSVFDDAFRDTAKELIERFNKSPKLNASLMLDNFLQMQYEIIAKQLTLLRDEVGPGERLLFLELPQTINVAHHEADKKWAQSWWKIAGYTIRCPDYIDAARDRVQEQCLELRRKSLRAASLTSTTASATSTPSPSPEEAKPQNLTDRAATTQNEMRSLKENQQPITTTQDANSLYQNQPIIQLDDSNMASRRSTVGASRAQQRDRFVNRFVNLDDVPIENVEPLLRQYLETNKAELSNRLVRTVELIPRQSSLNVNDMKLDVRAGAFSAVASFLFGFGAKVNVQRQREQFSQFVQQELYSSAFGKGAREFGWTFTPMPGTDRLLAGVRTTYAVVVVPEEATSLVLEANGCYFPRSAYQPNNFKDTIHPGRWGDDRTSRGCGEKSKAFVVPIPNGGIDGSNEFWVKSVSYKPVGKGKRIVVLIAGDNFSSQMGVLINGVPLIHSIGLAQPLIRDDSRVGAATDAEFKDSKVRGRIERVDSNKIIFSFEILDDFEGTPNITLVAPGKAIDINWLDNIEINGKYPASLNTPDNPCKNAADQKCRHVCSAQDTSPDCTNIGDEMFKGDPVRPLRIDSVEVFRVLGERKVSVLITGAGFVENSADFKVYVNGVEAPTTSVISATLIHVKETPAPLDENIQVTISANGKTIKSTAVANPAHLKVNKVTVVSYEAARGKEPAVLVVKLEGTGFPVKLDSSEPRRVRVTVTSSTEAFLRITNPDEAEVVTLKDPETQLTVSTVVVRKTPPKKGVE
jgi:hypothetical protein